MKKQKKRYLHYLLSAIILGGFFVWLFMQPRAYKWDITFDHESDEPLGCQIFDDLLSSSLPNGFEYRRFLPDSLDPQRDAVLYTKPVICGTYGRDIIEASRADTLVRFARQGGRVIVATYTIESFHQIDSLIATHYNLEFVYDDLNYCSSEEDIKADLKQSVKNLKNKYQPLDSSLYWKGDKPLCYPMHGFMRNSGGLFPRMPESAKVLLYRRVNYGKDLVDEAAFIVSYPNGGSIEFVSLPLLFTNYAVLDSTIVNLTQKLLLPVKDRHLYRITAPDSFDKTKVIVHTPNNDSFAFFRKRPALSLAFKLTMLLLILALLNQFRRRMRAIPLPPKTHNATLDFARTMGTFHYRRHDYREILLSQYAIMLHTLSETTVSDVERLSSLELRYLIHLRTGIEDTEISKLVQTVKDLRSQEDASLSEKDMMRLLDVIKDIKAKL